jgi:hypothetical protein
MEPLDLSVRPPRSPREKAAGLFFIPRTIDKIRASLPGGNMGPYFISGISQRLLDSLGIDLAQLTEVVRNAKSEDEVADWIIAHSDPATYEAINHALETRSQQQITTPEGRAMFESRYDAGIRSRYDNLFELIEADDAEMFAS